MQEAYHTGRKLQSAFRRGDFSSGARQRTAAIRARIGMSAIITKARICPAAVARLIVAGSTTICEQNDPPHASSKWPISFPKTRNPQSRNAGHLSGAYVNGWSCFAAGKRGHRSVDRGKESFRLFIDRRLVTFGRFAPYWIAVTSRADCGLTGCYRFGG